MTPKSTRLFILGIICGVCFAIPLLSWFVYTDNRTATEPPPKADTMTLPEGTPGNSAPPFALAACQGKQFGESCVMTNGSTTIDGVCFQSGDQLACGLSLPTHTTQ